MRNSQRIILRKLYRQLSHRSRGQTIFWSRYLKQKRSLLKIATTNKYEKLHFNYKY